LGHKRGTRRGGNKTLRSSHKKEKERGGINLRRDMRLIIMDPKKTGSNKGVLRGQGSDSSSTDAGGSERTQSERISTVPVTRRIRIYKERRPGGIK